MAETKHVAFPQPQNDTSTVWRYMGFDRFASLVREGRLYMPGAAQLGDPLEGTPPAGNEMRWRDGLRMAQTRDQIAAVLHNRESITGISQQWRNLYFVSCWNLGEFESNTMWLAYARDERSIAIRSTYAKLRDALPREVLIGKVRYIDYERDELPTVNLLEYIMHKDVYYRDECEVRAVLPAVSPPPFTPQSDIFERPEDPSIRAYLPKVDLKTFITGVVLHPKATGEFADSVNTVCEEAGLPRPRGSRALFPTVLG